MKKAIVILILVLVPFFFFILPKFKENINSTQFNFILKFIFYFILSTVAYGTMIKKIKGIEGKTENKSIFGYKAIFILAFITSIILAFITKL